MVWCTAFIAALATAGALPAWTELDHPWAHEVIEYAPVNPPAAFANPSVVLGPPSSGGPLEPDNSSVVSLGRAGGTITLGFKRAIENDPLNPMGLDFIVYSNCLWAGGNPQVKWQEPAIIEVSEDVNGNGIPDDPWYIIPGSRALQYDPHGNLPIVNEPLGIDNSEDPFLLAGTITNPNALDGDSATDQYEYNWGYAEMTPTAAPYLDNYLRPDDPLQVGLSPRSGGGDAFDISWAVDTEGNPANLERIHFVRITALVDRSMYALGYASPEIMAVAAVARDLDSDGNGIRDDYEVRVAGTDPLRAENTVLPLEIPALEGGSPPGALLGTAECPLGTRLRLFAADKRTGQGRPYSAVVDLTAPPAPEVDLGVDGLLKSGAARLVGSSVPDFVAAGIQPAQITIAYSSAEIAGLDEPSLTPYRFTGTAYTQDGITDVQVNDNANLVTFRSRYAGLFVLASIPGDGDQSGVGPQGVIDLNVAPGGGVVAGNSTPVVVTSGLIFDHNDDLVADGTLFTIATSSGAILTEDAAPEISGRQVASVSGAIAFEVGAPTTAGSAIVTVTSVGGGAYGELAYPFLPGPPAGPVGVTTIARETGAVHRVEIRIGPVRDAFGNAVADGTLLTAVLDGAVFASTDADLGQPGDQVLIEGGLGLLVTEVPLEADTFVLRVYDAEGAFLSQHNFEPIEFHPLPVRISGLLSALALGTALAAWRRAKVLYAKS